MGVKTVPITPDLRLIASILGGMRSMVNRKEGITDRQIGTQNGVEIDQDGVLGELAFAMLTNRWPDLSMTPRADSSDGVLNGYRYDVKAARKREKPVDLLARKPNPDVDVYVLAIIEEKQVMFPGYAWATDLFDDRRKTDKGHGPTYAIPQTDLLSWDTWGAAIKNKTPDSDELAGASIHP